jgi:hypothetical protein
LSLAIRNYNVGLFISEKINIVNFYSYDDIRDYDTRSPHLHGLVGQLASRVAGEIAFDFAPEDTLELAPYTGSGRRFVR